MNTAHIRYLAKYCGSGVALAAYLVLGGCNVKVEAPALTEFESLMKKADANDSAAQLTAAEKLIAGEGVKKNPERGVSILQKAATAGSVAAQFRLGECYQKGIGTKIDKVKSLEWYQKASAQGDAKAIAKVGRAYFLGEGVPADAVKAKESFEKAFALGEKNGAFGLGLMYHVGQGVQKDYEKSVDWYEKAIALGDDDARANLALIYFGQTSATAAERGRITVNIPKGVELVERAANNGNADAQSMLGKMYLKGDNVAKNMEKAIEYLTKAAAQGQTNAAFELGLIYFDGNGVPKDSGKAADLFQKAAAQGSAASQGNIGWMLFNGEGVSKDKVLAYAWVNLAAASGDETATKNRDIYERQLSLPEKLEGQRLSSGWVKGTGLIREAASGSPDSAGAGLQKRGTGTAFFVSKLGQAVTNHHVIAGCKEVKIEGRDGTVKVKATDAVSDLALLEVPGTVNETAPLLSNPSKLRQGDDVAVFGFPLNSVLSSGGNFTPGVVSALTGLGNNTNQIQITAPIQPGSSGSPVISKKGLVVGVVSMKLSDGVMAQATGQVGQNVNFAVGGQTLIGFLNSQGVDYSTGPFRFFEKSTADLADDARKWTVLVECWK